MITGETPQPDIKSQSSNALIPQADELLKGIDSGPFSPAAFSVLKGKVAQYLSEVTREAAAIAKRSQSDVISVRDVEAACEHLTVSPRARFYRHLGTFAGLSLGLAISIFGSMIVSNTFPIWAILLTLSSGFLGGVMLGLHIKND